MGVICYNRRILTEFSMKVMATFVCHYVFCICFVVGCIVIFSYSGKCLELIMQHYYHKFFFIKIICTWVRTSDENFVVFE